MSSAQTPLRVLAVGAGYFSQYHYQAWHNVTGAQCVGIVDHDIDKARDVAARWGIAQVYQSIEPALAALQVDLVDLIVPPQSQRELVSQCLANHLPMICQKPFGVDLADAIAMTEAAERAAVTLVIHENFRWQAWYREAKRLINLGTLGSLHSVAFRLRPGDGQGPRAYLDRQPYFQTMPRLLVVETAIHWIDTFRFLLGDVNAVYAQLRTINPVIKGEDAGYILFEFDGGSTGLFDGNRLNDHVATNPRRTMGEMWLEGSHGVLRLDGDARLWWKPHQAAEQEHTFDRGADDSFGGGACEALQSHVVKHFTDGAALENTARAYLSNLTIQEAVYRSHALRRRIELS